MVVDNVVMKGSRVLDVEGLEGALVRKGLRETFEFLKTEGGLDATAL